MISAGEHSGEMHGAEVVKEAERRNEKIEFFGLGGDLMAQAGVELLAHLNQTAVMGLTEVLSSLRRILKIRSQMCSLLAAQKPDALLVIDSPDFNFALCKAAKKAGVPVVYYICPQVWAWRQGRIKHLERYVDRRAVILPFEVDYYKRHNLSVDMVGYPLFDELDLSQTKAGARSKLGLSLKDKVLAVLPGSRRSVAKRLTGPMLGAADILLESFPDLTAALPRSIALDEEYLSALTEKASSRVRSKLKIFTGQSQLILKSADAAILASGTSTAEGAILGTPMAVTYRTSAISWFLAKLLVKTPYVSLVNLVAGRRVVPELLQSFSTPSCIAEALSPLISGGQERDLMIKELKNVSRLLYGEGPAADSADRGTPAGEFAKPRVGGRVLDIVLQQIRGRHDSA
jgi:lipid-A-disaccharide synthase